MSEKVILLQIQNDGALAHLARAFDWQSRGDEFESHMLHKLFIKKHLSECFLFFYPNSPNFFA